MGQPSAEELVTRGGGGRWLILPVCLVTRCLGRLSREQLGDSHHLLACAEVGRQATGEGCASALMGRATGQGWRGAV